VFVPSIPAARLRVPLAVALGLALTAMTAAVAATNAPTALASGSVTLRTTDDAGRCAGRPTAKRVHGITCPTFRLYYAAPSGHPRGLLVIFHGHGHNGEQYVAQLESLAARDRVVAVAMGTDELSATKPNYRGPFDSVDAEARDAAAAIHWARAKFGTGKRTYLLGVSMGGSGLAYFVDAATRPAHGDPDAGWVQSMQPLPLAGLVDAEGISNLAETWAEATGFDKTSAHEIEGETGGTPATASAAYRARSLALLPSKEWRATGLPVVAVVHDVDDGLVPYNQTYEARVAVLAARIPLRTYDVVFQSACAHGNQTTLTAQGENQIPGFPTSQVEARLCLAGHANENDPQTPVMRAAIAAFDALLNHSDTAVPTIENPTPG
jgi:hypothetical protein